MRDPERAPISQQRRGLGFLLGIFRSALLRKLILSSLQDNQNCQLKTQCIILPLNPVVFAFPYLSAQAATDLITKQVLCPAAAVHAGALISPNQVRFVIFGG